MSTNGHVWKRVCIFWRQYREEGEPTCKRFRSVLSAGKVTFTLFWEINGPILEHYQDGGQIVVHGTVLCLKRS